MRTGAAPELLRENEAYFCVKDAEEREVSLLNLGGTTRAFVPFGGGGVFIYAPFVHRVNNCLV